MDHEILTIEARDAERIVLKCYGIKGRATPLPGYSDLNFRIEISDRNNENDVNNDNDQSGYILKISLPDEDAEYLDFQQKLLRYIERKGNQLMAPRVLDDVKGNSVASFIDNNGNERLTRLLTWLPGRIWSAVNPQLNDLRHSLGIQCGRLTQAFQGFDHHQAHREMEWNLAHSLWTKDHLHLFDEKKKKLVIYFQERFESKQDSYSRLRKAVVHNDANDNNLIVSKDLLQPTVKAVIDYGDSVFTQVINDLAIACAYGIMGHNAPLDAAIPIVEGYHSSFPLEERELEHLYSAIAMRWVVSVTQSAIKRQEEPDNEYLYISEKPAWELLEKWYGISEDFAHYSFRQTCGWQPHPQQENFKDYAAQNNWELSELFPTISKNSVHRLDLSVSSRWLGLSSDFDDLDLLEFKLDQLQKKHPNKILSGGYLEPRIIYTTSEYGRIGNSGPENRTVHLGIDFWLPTGTAVHALFDGEVVTAINDAGNKEYGGLIILEHRTENLQFFTLYGHLSIASITGKKIGQKIRKGDCIGYLGHPKENGNWAPHLHFQVMLSLLDYTKDFPGVAYHRQVKVWQGICPDPNLLFKLEALHLQNTKENRELIDYRNRHLGKSLSLNYDRPIHMVRGSGAYLIDSIGRRHLDTVNNVAHVGHEHPDVVRAGQEQMALLNTNSRYLHNNINELAEELLKTLPPELSVLHFVNSGSEANELALRMAKAATGEQDIIASEVGYHGNTNLTVDVSSYKFDGRGGGGAPEHTHIFPLPDAFRGKYRGEGTGQLYADEVQLQIDAIHEKSQGVAALIVEPIISCGGQIELPEGFLAKAYEYVRKAGGVCISDEVQVGCGRVGKTFWGFQLLGVVPDIITIGKPLGNGHPLAAVACTPKVAEKFANGMEYFNTFGGNPVSCAIGTEVLRVVEREKLQEHAAKVGGFLKSGLQSLVKDFPIIGDVRGQGLFLGFELVNTEMHPLTEQAHYLANRMRDNGILMGTDGPDRNVLKIKPPMVFSLSNAEELLFYLRKVFLEDFMQRY